MSAVSRETWYKCCFSFLGNLVQTTSRLLSMFGFQLWGVARNRYGNVNATPWRDQHGRVEVVTTSNRGLEGVKLLNRIEHVDETAMSGAGTAAAIIDHIIEGPTGMAFAAGTASVSFYLGRYSDFFLSSKKENGQREMQKYVRKTYVLVRRGDDPSERWTANGDFVAEWREDELWLKADLKHFSFYGVLKRLGIHGREEPILQNSMQYEKIPKPPRGSKKYPDGYAEFQNSTRHNLEVFICPEAFTTNAAGSHAQTGGGGATIGSMGVNATGRTDRSRSVSRQPAPYFYTVIRQQVFKMEKHGMSLPGGAQAFLLWCSVTKPVTPEELGIIGNLTADNPAGLSEDQLNDKGYEVLNIGNVEKQFHHARSNRTCRKVQILKLWASGTIAPESYSRILPKRLTNPNPWFAVVPCDEDDRSDPVIEIIRKYLNQNCVLTSEPTCSG